MGRRLTPSERRQRDRERERRAAARRAKTAARRSREKEAREKERSRQKAAKEAKTEKEIQENRKIQKVFDRYLEDINSFHKEYKPRKFVGSFEYRQRTRKYEATPPPENKEFSWKEYKRKPFESKAFKWKSTLMKYAQINCQDCRSVHILQSQSLSMFFFFPVSVT